MYKIPASQVTSKCKSLFYDQVKKRFPIARGLGGDNPIHTKKACKTIKYDKF